MQDMSDLAALEQFVACLKNLRVAHQLLHLKLCPANVVTQVFVDSAMELLQASHAAC